MPKYKATAYIRLSYTDDRSSESDSVANQRKQDFDLVQRIRGLDTRTSPKQDTVYLFSGVLICGCCGSRMTRKTNRMNGKEYHYYYCPTGKKHGCANPVMLKESNLIDCVQESLKRHQRNYLSPPRFPEDAL